MKVFLLSIALCALPLASSAQTRFSNWQTVFVCLPPAGSCKAQVLREGKDSALVKYLEDCQVEKGIGSVRFSLFGMFDKQTSTEEWVTKEDIQKYARDCP